MPASALVNSILVSTVEGTYVNLTGVPSLTQLASDNNAYTWDQAKAALTVHHAVQEVLTVHSNLGAIRDTKTLARYLEETGHTGVRDDCKACPLASLYFDTLTQALGPIVRDAKVLVMGSMIELEAVVLGIRPDGDSSRVHIVLLVPETVALFIAEFDQGDYPQLITDPKDALRMVDDAREAKGQAW